MPFGQKLARGFLSLALVVFAGGLAAAALVRYSPGFDIDENSWNPRISASTLAVMHARREEQNHLLRFYGRYVAAALHGDLGESVSLRAPVAELLWNRAPVSARLIGWGTLCGLIAGGVLAWIAVWPRSRILAGVVSSTNGLLLAVPPAVLALGFFFTRAPLVLAVGLAVLPRIFGTMRALLEEARDSTALLAARARGLAPVRIALRYVIGPAAPRLVALTGVALVLAFGIVIPVEALCDVPGIGQLAWKAALARDLPLLSGLALIIAFLVAFVHEVGEILA